MSTKYSLLIVEDDAFALQSMVTLLGWQELGIDQVYQAANGQDAYEIYLQKHPHIIITDLQMPVMDGLSLIRTVREVECDTKTRFIIMSCLDEFPQVQQALNLGVDHYFLKANTSRKDIQSIITKVVQELNKNNEKQMPLQHIHTLDMMIQNLYKGYPLCTEDATIVFNYTGIAADEGYSLLLLCMTQDAEGKSTVSHISESIKRTFMNLCSSEAIMFHPTFNRYIFILKEDQRDRLVKMVDQFCSKLSESTKLNMQLGMSSLHSDVQHLSDALSEAKHALDTCYFTGESFALYNEQKGNTLPTEIAAKLLSLHDIAFHLPHNFVNDYEKRMYHITSQSYPDSVTFKKTLCEMLLWIYSRADKSTSLEDIVVNCNHQILTSETLKESVNYFEQIAINMFQTCFFLQIPEGIRAALLYIHSNLDRPITLKELAAQACLNPSYFSTLFHKTMRQNPINYINSARIERAKLLLRNTDLPISQIALSLGFSQDLYFFRIFKQLTNETPNEYRSKFSQTKQTQKTPDRISLTESKESLQ